MFILLGLLLLKLNIAICQFPEHLDFEKVGEKIHKNEKYNVLRPTIHTVRDYFEDFMQRRETTDFPTKRVFIDKNGFRHFWSGFVDRSHNLRKHGGALDETVDAQDNSIETNNDIEARELSDDEDATTESTVLSNNPEYKENATDIDVPETVAAEVAVSDANNVVLDPPEIIVAESDPPNIIVVTNIADTAAETDQTTQESKGESEEVETTTKERPRRRPKRLFVPMPPPEVDNILRADQKERTIAKTSFFCPFFGVVTLQSYLENENEEEKGT